MRVGSRVWSPRSRLLMVAGAVLSLIGLVWVTWWLLGKTGSADGAGIANVLALPATVLGTFLAAVGLRSRPRADDPAVLANRAHRLLKLVARDEERVLLQLLGDTGQPRPADVGFVQPEAARLRWRTDGGAHTGSLDTVAAFYQQLTRGRLAVLGEAGSGKTVLVIRLLLDLVAAQRTEPSADRISVPVRLSLPAFTSMETTPAAMRDRLDSWIAEQLVAVHDLEPAVARALVTDGWILPILDGLDEMDPYRAVPVRARAVVAALNVPAGADRWGVVLTCRAARYDQLAGTATGALQDATVVTAQRLDIEQVVTWLAHRFPDGAEADGVQARWMPVVATLRAEPTGALARCLTSPLRLFLAVTTYQDSRTTPHVLLTLDSAELDDYLFGCFIPAVSENCPRLDGGYYAAREVERWLRTLADHLARMRQSGYSGIDLHLHELWRSRSRPSGWRRVLTAPISIVVAFIWSKPSPTRALKRLDLSTLGTRAGRRRLATSLGLGLGLSLLGGFLMGFPVAFTHGVGIGSVVALAIGLTLAPVGFALGLGEGFSDLQRAAAKPSSPMRQGLARDFAQAVVFGGALALLHGVLVSVASLVISGFVFVVYDLLLVFVFGFAIGLRKTPWPHYVLAVRGLARNGRLPSRPARFLDWAHTAGLVRLAGTAVQFRHRDLQDRLTSSQLKQNELHEGPHVT